MDEGNEDMGNVLHITSGVSKNNLLKVGPIEKVCENDWVLLDEEVALQQS